MIPEKTKRALRRMRRRTASSRRRRVATLRNTAGRPTALAASRSDLRAVDDAARSDGTRLPTRQELRVEAELEYATQELGLA